MPHQNGSAGSGASIGARPILAGCLAIIVVTSAIVPPRPALAAQVKRLDPIYDTIRTSMNLRTELMWYAPTIPPTDGAAVILFSSSWGWPPLMQDTASKFAATGRHVVGVDSLKYFGKMLDAAGWAKQLRILRAHVNEKAGRPADAAVILVGFGFGADIIPYMLNRGGADGVAGTLLIAPGKTGAVLCRLHLQLHLPIPEEEQFDVGEEIGNLPLIPVVLMEGTLDEEADGRSHFALLKGPRKYAPIVGGNRQFRETRDVYFDYAAEALDWIDSAAMEEPPPGGAPQDGAMPPAEATE